MSKYDWKFDDLKEDIKGLKLEIEDLKCKIEELEKENKELKKIFFSSKTPRFK